MKTIALYVGSFNPFHLGHLNIVNKIEDIFGKENIIIAFGINPMKNKSFTDEYVSKIQAITGYKCCSYNTYLHTFINKLEEGGDKVILVRGLRNGNDLAHETNQLKIINDLAKRKIRTMYLHCDEEYNQISSSAIRAMNEFEEGSGDMYTIK